MTVTVPNIKVAKRALAKPNGLRCMHKMWDNLFGGDSRSHHPKASFGGLFHVMVAGN
ncbi:hypothetical protein NLY44_05395 [Mesorhizobium sp. C089B]|uniref:hypothetical protein n=1 Tax=unclassified Mesorhizobium TaxID=325217 RepID=UPI00041BE0E0|nr:hypothetical protein [Mesorhizobium sp. C089B]WJI52128.1 hypothetical protein NLY44_05395 [Mesorhizobium sp. C089B]